MYKRLQGSLNRRLPVSDAMTLVSNRLWTSDLLESHIRVVRTTKPVEPPVATSL
jgi:hypothetical protein